MTSTRDDEETTLFTARGRDRRGGFGELLIALTRTLTERGDPAMMRGAFEEMLRRMLPVRSVQLRDGRTRWSTRPDGEGDLESVTLEVPGPIGSGGVLEIRFGAGAAIGDWDLQLLGQASHVAALVLEIERCRSVATKGPNVTLIKPKRDDAAPLVGSSSAMREVRARIERVAQTDFTVLVEGDSGVGKELVAHQIHDLSRRRHAPFVAVNCAALVETLLEAELFGIEERTATGVRGRRGKFEHADKGTLFLDEIGDLSLSAQAKLLRVIQDLAVERVGSTGTHAVDIRIIAATNRNLADMVEQRLFRRDLFYRLSGVDIRVPPLRDRRDDILDLAQHFLSTHTATRRLRLSAAAADALVTHDWPGNVRELERLIEGVVALSQSDVIEVNDLPPAVRRDFSARLLPSLDGHDTMREWGSRYARLMLDRCGGNKRAASRALGISYHTLGAYLKRASGTSAPSSPEEGTSADPLADECAAEA